MVSVPPVTLRCRNANYTYQSTITATVHLYTDPTGKSVNVKHVPKKEAEKHTQISETSISSIVRLLDVTEISSFTPNAWLVLEHANKGTLCDLLAHVRGADGSIPRKIPVAFCFHILASILDAVVAIQETHGVQHIDLHAGNVVFHMSPGPWPPLVKVIDFGKTVQLPEEASQDDVPWDSALSPSVGKLVRALLVQTDVLEDEFLIAIRPLGAQMSPLQTLRIAKADVRTRAEAVGENMPDWILSYFGHKIVTVNTADDAEGAHQDDETKPLNDMISRLRI